MDVGAMKIVITGGARGLGLAMAQELASAGARIGIIDLDRQAVEQALAGLPGQIHVGAVADVSDENAVTGAFDQLTDSLEGIDGLVNNAGITRDGLLVKARDGRIESKMSLDQWRAVIDVNLTGVFLCGREVAGRMIESGRGGVIINISSISRNGNFGQSNYAAAKAGVAAMTVTWAKELARHDIRVASISPGFVNTELVARMPEKAVQRITSQVPLGRLGIPEEIAQTARFIFENDYISGRDFAIDGGLRL